MMTRQAIGEAILRTTLLTILFTLLMAAAACSPPSQPVATPTSLPPPASPVPSPLPTFAMPPTATPLACLTQPGRVEEGVLDSFKPAQEFRIYLPPCYDEKPDERYPVLYLLHGQTYNDDQWLRLGAVDVLDELILSGESQPFIIVFPDDRYWNLVAGPGFGDRLINHLIPHIDSSYRTVADRQHRAIGGLSRGAGWSLRLGLTQWQLFGRIGLHSLAVLQKDAAKLKDWIPAIPPASRPTIFMDIGDNDQELAMAQRIESQFTDYDISHEWHLYSGAHTENYWRSHVEEYIRWYAGQWKQP